MSDPTEVTRKWTKLEALDRRVLGVLVEKAKTTPDVYPLTLKGLVAGCNQKSNRFPQMEVDEDAVEEAIDRLRNLHAVAVIQGDGRVEKYRHLAYDWLGVDKVELAVMAELLLRGAQTIGELRGRAARMEPIKGMSDLGPLLENLMKKSLIVYLTPPGRGAVVTHNLYQPREMDKVRREHGVSMPDDGHPVPKPGPPAPDLSSRAAAEVTEPDPSRPVAPSADNDEVARLREDLAHLRASLTAFRDEAEASISELQQQLADLNRQLGN